MEKEVSEAERRVVIKRNYSEKVTLLVKQDVNEKELYGLIRHFFADFLRLEYEFTYEELSQELNKIFIKQALKQRIDKMLEDLSWFEYMPDHELSQEEKKRLLNDFKDMIDQLILDLENKPGKSSFFDKIFGKKGKEKHKEDDVKLEIQSAQEQLPNNDLASVQQKNQEMIKELRKEMVDDKESAPVLGDFINDANGSNNLLLFTEKEEPAPKNTRIEQQKNIQSKPKDVVKDFSPVKEIPPLTKEIVAQVSASNNAQNFQNIRPTDNKKISQRMPSILIEDNDPEIVKIKKLIEESYNLYYLRKIDSARVKYMDALSVYNKFSYEKKTKTYIELYDLYKKIK